MPTPDIIGESRARLPVAGRIRIGIRSGKAMKAIDRFRFTTPDKDLIDAIAAAYGGEVKPWSDPKANPQNQYEVITTVNRIPIVLMPNSISQWYEQWTGGGRARRCTGAECWLPGKEEPVPCLCRASGELACRKQTRVSVILPDFPMRGVWMLATKSKNADHEMRGMTEVLYALARVPLVRAELSVEARTQMQEGKRSHFVVPVISIPESPMSVVNGQASLAGLSAGELPSGGSLGDLPALPAPAASVDDDIVDAELVDDDEIALRDRCHALADRYMVSRDLLWRGMRTISSSDPDRDAVERLEAGLAAMEAGRLVPVGFDANGWPLFDKRDPS